MAAYRPFIALLCASLAAAAATPGLAETERLPLVIAAGETEHVFSVEIADTP